MCIRIDDSSPSEPYVSFFGCQLLIYSIAIQHFDKRSTINIHANYFVSRLKTSNFTVCGDLSYIWAEYYIKNGRVKFYLTFAIHFITYKNFIKKVNR